MLSNEDVDSADITVNYHDISALAEPTLELMIPKTPTATLASGDFVFYDVPAPVANEDEVDGGVVMDIIDASHIVVHMCEKAPIQSRRWTPLWTLPNGREVKCRHATKKKTHPAAQPLTVTVSATDVIVSGDYDEDKGMIQPGMLDHLLATGVVM